MTEEGLDRRTFLKTAAAIGTTMAAASTVSAETAKKPSSGLPGERIIGRPGSDFMVDVIKATGIEYIASNPASSFRSLHESIVNYGGNRKPEFLTCMHEEPSVAMAQGYAKAAGKPMGVLAHGSVGLQHAAMAVYNAWCDRVPVIIFGGNFMDAAHRRPGVEWYHCVQDPAGMLRDFVKWDDQPASLQHFAESVMRAYKFAMTPPMEPVVIIADGMLKEHPVDEDAKLDIPKLTLSAPPQGESGALKEAAKMMASAENLVIIADRAARSQEGVRRMVELAEALNAPVVDLGSRMNFPTTHYLARSEDGRALVREADVVLMLEVADPWGQLNTISDPQHEYRRIAKPDVKLIHVTLADNLMKSNYQDAQRFCPCDLSISGDAEATLAALTEAVKKEIAPAAVGAALANRDKGILTAVIQPDGDLMYAPGVLWTAAHHKIPILMLMHNNRAYHQEVMHLQKMAGLHNRRMDTARIGTTIENPHIDYALLARAQGVWAEGPITDPAAIAPALQRAVAVVKRGEPALVDVVTQGR